MTATEKARVVRPTSSASSALRLDTGEGAHLGVGVREASSHVAVVADPRGLVASRTQPAGPERPGGTDDPADPVASSTTDDTPPEATEQVAESGNPEAEGEAAGAGQATPAQLPATGGAPAPVATPPDPEPDARTLGNYQRLARIFAAMKPDEAAPVLSQLDDAQLEGILMAMQGRNAAPILAAMDPARVASISRRVLGGGS